MNTEKNQISSFSPHLFWDVDSKKVGIDTHQKWLINRVLEYGLYRDWQLLQEYYGIDTIVNTAVTLRDLSKKTATFLSIISGFPKEKFACYSTTQSHLNFWDS